MDLQASDNVEPGCSVTIFLGDGSPEQQPDDVRICPLGMQLYSKKSIPQFEMIEFKLDIPSESGISQPITCTGVVVHCRPESDSDTFRIWIKFLDVPEHIQERIKQASKDSNLLCPDCENF